MSPSKGFTHPHVQVLIFCHKTFKFVLRKSVLGCFTNFIRQEVHFSFNLNGSEVPRTSSRSHKKRPEECDNVRMAEVVLCLSLLLYCCVSIHIISIYISMYIHSYILIPKLRCIRYNKGKEIWIIYDIILLVR